MSDNTTNTDDEIDLLEIALLLWKRKWSIAIFAIVGGLLAFGYAKSQNPTYQADALIQIESKKSGLALPIDFGGGLGSGGDQTTGEIEIMQSRMVLGTVVDRLNLQISAKPKEIVPLKNLRKLIWDDEPKLGLLEQYSWNNEAISVGLLRVPQMWEDSDFTLRAMGDEKFEVTLPDGALVTGQLREPLAVGEDFAIRVDALLGNPGKVFELKLLPRDDAISALSTRFRSSEQGRSTGIFRLILTGDNKQQIVKILDEIALSYQAQNISRSSAEARKSLEFIEEQLPIAEKELAAAQTALNDFRSAKKSVDLEYETQILLNQSTEIEAKLNELDLQEEELKRKYTVNHPTYQALLENRAQLNEQLNRLKGQGAELPDTQKEVFNLTRDLEVAQNVYFAMLSRKQELSVIQASAIGNVRLLDNAVAQKYKIAPKTTLVTAIGIVLGLLLSIGWIVLRNALHHGVRGTMELEKLGLPVFASIQETPSQMTLPGRKKLQKILALTDPTDIVVESFRSLRTALHFGMLDAANKSLMLTSSAPGAGKSFTAVNLAVVSAQSGQRVCLIDADMRRGTTRHYFGIEKDHKGLAEYLAGDAKLEDVMVDGPVDHLKVISTGRFPPNPSELLMRPTFKDLLQQLDKDFDLIVIDAPPTLAVTDPVVMAKHTGAVMYVARHGQTPIFEVEAVIQTFRNAGVKLTGAILNGFKASESRGQYYYYNQRYAYKKRD